MPEGVMPTRGLWRRHPPDCSRQPFSWNAECALPEKMGTQHRPEGKSGRLHARRHVTAAS